MSESCQTKKRNFAETDLTPPKMPSYKAGKVMEDGECDEAISKVDSAFFPKMAALVPKLLEDSGFKPSETKPTMLLKELQWRQGRPEDGPRSCEGRQRL